MLVCCSAPLTRSGLDPAAFKAEYEGKPTALYTLVNEAGMEVCITNFGGRIVSCMVPDKDGVLRDVVLGFDNVKDYFPENNLTDFGAAIGRYANRIKDARFTLDGKEWQLTCNNYGHCLHGGVRGWQYKVYEVVCSDDSHLKLVMHSPDGDNGFPGAVTAYVTYTLTEDNAIDILYEATTDAPTVVNMTNHSYFNLSGDPAGHSICDDYMVINASRYTPSDSTFMTTGEIASVEGTAMDFRTGKKIGAEIDNYGFVQLRNGNGYDHNWCLDNDCDITVPAAVLYCPLSGIKLTEYTDQPGMQVYSGNFLDGTLTGKGGAVYAFRHAICLESQLYPDSPNKSDWPSATLLPAQTYSAHTIFAFDTVKATPCNGNCAACKGCEQ